MHHCNLGLFLSSNIRAICVDIISVSSKMSETNTEVVSLLKSLSDHFDSLHKDVDALKGKEACRSASVLLTARRSPRTTLPRRASSRDMAAKDADRDRVLRPVPQRAVPALAPAAVTARARAKLRRLRTAHAARESDRDPRDVRPVAGPTGCPTMKTPQWTIPRSSLATQRLRISQMIK